MKIKNFAIAMTMLSFLAGASSYAAELKIGYVDIQKAIQSTSTGQKAKKELKDTFEKKKKELGKMEADLKKMGEDLEKKRSVLSQEVMGRKQAELQQEMLKYRELVARSQREIQEKEVKLTQPILDAVRKAIEQTAKSGNYTFILEKKEQGIAWAKAELDLTSTIVEAYEKTLKKKKKK